jgi:hypothetical protein
VTRNHQAEAAVGEAEGERVVALEEGPVAESGAPPAGALEVGFLEIDAGERRLQEALEEPRGDLSGAAADVERRAGRRMAGEDRLLLRPDRVCLGGQVPHHRLVRHLLRLRAVRVVHGRPL